MKSACSFACAIILCSTFDVPFSFHTIFHVIQTTFYLYNNKHLSFISIGYHLIIFSLYRYIVHKNDNSFSSEGCYNVISLYHSLHAFCLSDVSHEDLLLFFGLFHIYVSAFALPLRRQQYSFLETTSKGKPLCIHDCMCTINLFWLWLSSLVYQPSFFHSFPPHRAQR